MRTYIRGVVLNIFLGRVSAMSCLERFLPCLDAGPDMCNVHVWSGVRDVCINSVNTIIELNNWPYFLITFNHF